MLVHAEGPVESNDGAMDGAGDDERNIFVGSPAGDSARSGADGEMHHARQTAMGHPHASFTGVDPPGGVCGCAGGEKNRTDEKRRAHSPERRHEKQ